MANIKDQIKELKTQIEMNKNLIKKRYFVRYFTGGRFVTRPLKIKLEKGEE